MNKLKNIGNTIILENKLKQQEIQAQIQTNPFWAINIDGKRAVDSELSQYLSHRIFALGYEQEQACARFNEIIWSSRFGDMVINNKTKEENSLKRAINCCLKLLREGRWDTSDGFQAFQNRYVTRLANIDSRRLLPVAVCLHTSQQNCFR